MEYPQLIPNDNIRNALRSEFGSKTQVGCVNPNLSWTHYRLLLGADAGKVRTFYESEAAKHSWSARELERQIGSQLYERLAASRDKEGVMRLALQGQETQGPIDVFKDRMWTSRYQMHLPTVEQLEAEVRRELRFIRQPTAAEREKALQEISDISQELERGRP